MCSVGSVQCTVWRRPPGVQPRPGRHRRQHLLGTPSRPLHQPGWHGFSPDTHTALLCTAHPNIHPCEFAIRRLSSLIYGLSMLSVWAGCRMCLPTTGRRAYTTCLACRRANLAPPPGAGLPPALHSCCLHVSIALFDVCSSDLLVPGSESHLLRP